MRLWFTMLTVIVLDQISKWLVVSNMELGQSQPLIKGVINLTYVQNQGAAFGLFDGNTWLFIVSAAVVVAAISIYHFKHPIPNHLQISLGLITGGAVGNFIDRSLYRYVIDFFDLGWWPVFNIADMAIVCGGILLIIYTFKYEKQEQENA
ncbi:MAG TPA: signal peptidase II [Syntrophomonadaceae bacterium]|nr:signal peptidase II [Syntrophomonadaceae bacterium]HRX21742.1 signal peptidase II [Syntrophomonadaceae bacterium]